MNLELEEIKDIHVESAINTIKGHFHKADMSLNDYELNDDGRDFYSISITHKEIDAIFHINIEDNKAKYNLGLSEFCYVYYLKEQNKGHSCVDEMFNEWDDDLETAIERYFDIKKTTDKLISLNTMIENLYEYDEFDSDLIDRDAFDRDIIDATRKVKVKYIKIATENMGELKKYIDFDKLKNGDK